MTRPSLWLAWIAVASRANARPTPERTSASMEASWSTSATPSCLSLPRWMTVVPPIPDVDAIVLLGEPMTASCQAP